MPVTVRLATADAFALGTLSGDVTWNDLAAAMRALYGRPDADPDVHVLWDGRAITSLNVIPDELPAMMALRQELMPAMDGGKTAVVMSRDTDYLMARLFGSQVRQIQREHRIFDALDDALAFLGRDALPDSFDRTLVAI